MVDFTFNLKKFNDMCKDIAQSISMIIEEYYIDISYASGVISLNRDNPRKMYRDIDNIRSRETMLSNKNQRFEETLNLFNSFDKSRRFSDYFQIKNYYNTHDLAKSFHFLAMKNDLNVGNTFGSLMWKSISTTERLRDLMMQAGEAFSEDLSCPVLMNIPFSFVIEHPGRLLECAEYAVDAFRNQDIIFLINEYHIQKMLSDSMKSMVNDLPENTSLGLNNCYISSKILVHISLFDFRTILLSENITRNIYMYKNRMKVINGLQIFLEQLDIPMFAKNIKTEEEYQIIRDLNIKYCSGNFIESLLGK